MALLTAQIMAQVQEGVLDDDDAELVYFESLS